MPFTDTLKIQESRKNFYNSLIRNGYVDSAKIDYDSFYKQLDNNDNKANLYNSLVRNGINTGDPQDFYGRLGYSFFSDENKNETYKPEESGMNFGNASDTSNLNNTAGAANTVYADYIAKPAAAIREKKRQMLEDTGISDAQAFYDKYGKLFTAEENRLWDEMKKEKVTHKPNPLLQTDEYKEIKNIKNPVLKEKAFREYKEKNPDFQRPAEEYSNDFIDVFKEKIKPPTASDNEIYKDVLKYFNEEKQQAEAERGKEQDKIRNFYNSAFIPQAAFSSAYSQITAGKEITDPDRVINAAIGKAFPRIEEKLNSEFWDDAKTLSMTKDFYGKVEELGKKYSEARFEKQRADIAGEMHEMQAEYYAELNKYYADRLDKEAEKIYNRLIDTEYVAKKVPKSTLGYVTGELKRSIIGKLVSLATETDSERRIYDMAVAKYNPNVAESILSGAVNITADMPAFGIGSRIGGGALKLAVNRAEKNIIKAAAERGINISRSFASRMASEMPVNRILQWSLPGGMSFGVHGMAHEALDQAQAGEFDPLRLVGAGGASFVTGATLGGYNRLTRKWGMNAAKGWKAPIWAAKFAGEVGVFEGMGVLERGELPTLEEMGHTPGMLLALRVFHLPFRRADISRNINRAKPERFKGQTYTTDRLRTLLGETRFTADELEDLKRHGADERDVAGALAKGGREFAEKIVDDPNVATTTKIKVLNAMGGSEEVIKAIGDLNKGQFVAYAKAENADGRHVVLSYDAQGNLFERQTFRTKEGAEKEAKRLNGAGLDNTAGRYEYLAGEEYAREALEKTVELTGKSAEQLNEIFKKDAGKRTEEEQQAVRIYTGQLQYGVKSRKYKAERDGKDKLDERQADELITRMEQNAAEAPQLELTPENWEAEFGEDGIVETPVGNVKMGDNQYRKIIKNGRQKEFGMIKPTLTNPDVVLEVPSEAIEGQETERPNSYLFIKTFNVNGEKIKFYTSVTVSKNGLEVVVSNHILKPKQVNAALTAGKLRYQRTDIASRPNASNPASLEQLSEADNTVGTSESKGNENNLNEQKNNQAGRNEEAQALITDRQILRDFENADIVYTDKEGNRIVQKVKIKGEEGVWYIVNETGNFAIITNSKGEKIDVNKANIEKTGEPQSVEEAYKEYREGVLLGEREKQEAQREAEKASTVQKIAEGQELTDEDARVIEDNGEEIEKDVQAIAAEQKKAEIERITAEAPKQKDGEVDYDKLMEQSPEDFAVLYENESGADETRKALTSVSENISKKIQAAQKKIENSTSFNEKITARKTVAELADRKKRVDELIEERYKDKGDVEDNKDTGDISDVVDNDTEIQPAGKGQFGNIYDQFKGKAKEAINFLMQRKEGEATEAFYREDIGDIDLPYGKTGKDGFGLAHIEERRKETGQNTEELLDTLEDVINNGTIIRKNDRAYLQKEDKNAVVRLDYDGKAKNWVVTAYFLDSNELPLEEGSNKILPSGGRTSDVTDNETPKRQGKGTINSENEQKTEEKINTLKNKIAGYIDYIINKYGEFGKDEFNHNKYLSNDGWLIADYDGAEVVVAKQFLDKVLKMKQKKYKYLYKYVKNRGDTDLAKLVHEYLILKTGSGLWKEKPEESKKAEVENNTNEETSVAESTEQKREYEGGSWIKQPYSQSGNGKQVKKEKTIYNAPIRERIKEIGEPQSRDEAIALWVLQGGKIRWSDKLTQSGNVASGGFGRHLGYGNKERLKYINITDNKGRTPEELAEHFETEDTSGLFTNMDTMEILNEVLNVVSRVNSIGEAFKYIYDERLAKENARANSEEGYAESLREQAEKEQLEDMTKEEFEADEVEDAFANWKYEKENTNFVKNYNDDDRQRNNSNDRENGRSVGNSRTGQEQNDTGLEEEGDQRGLERIYRRGDSTDAVLGGFGRQQSQHAEERGTGREVGHDVVHNEFRTDANTVPGEDNNGVGRDESVAGKSVQDDNGRLTPTQRQELDRATADYDAHIREAEQRLSNARKEYEATKKETGKRQSGETQTTLFGEEKPQDLFNGEVKSDFGDANLMRIFEEQKRKVETAEARLNALREGRDKFIADSREAIVSQRETGSIDNEQLRIDNEGNRDEKERIRAEAQAAGTFMKAPNGKATKLNERAWLQVRTKAFKEWFGDWENDPKNASKVVDENGEPLAVYHGTPGTSGFTVFDENKIGSTNDSGIYGRGFYFTLSRGNAKMYSQGKGDIYTVFLNIKNPFVFSDSNSSDFFERMAKGGNTSKLPMWGGRGHSFGEWYKRYTEIKQDVESGKHDSVLNSPNSEYRFYRTEEREAQLINDLLGKDGYSIVINPRVLVTSFKSRDFSEALKKDGYDGTFKIGDISSLDEFIAFSSSQIKSATENNGKFDKNSEDIRLQAMQDLEAVNERFNGELQQYIDGKISSTHQFNIGSPKGVLSSLFPDIPFRIKQDVLRKAKEKHGIDLAGLKDLPVYLSNPIAVFKSKDGQGKIILTEIKDGNGNNIIAAIHLNKTAQQGKEYFEVNDIRSLYGKEKENVLRWINDGLLEYTDKEKSLNYISEPPSPSNSGRAFGNSELLNSTTKIIENFENPKFSEADSHISGRKFEPISSTEAEALINHLQKTGLARNVFTDEASMREYLEKHLGKDGAEQFMVWYHGSINDFDKFERINAFTRSYDGIYFSNNKDIPEDYGNILYEVELPELSDEQKPFSEKDRKNIEAYLDFSGKMRANHSDINFDADVGEVISQLKNKLGSVEAAHNWLMRAGVDGYTRESEADGRIAIMFNDKAIKIKNKTDIRFMSMPQGEVYGFVTPEGDIYLDPKRMNANTPIHEFGHLWVDFVEKGYSELFEKIKEVTKDSPYLREVMDNPAYKNLTDIGAIKEAFVTAMGDKGEKILQSDLPLNEKLSMRNRFLKVMHEFWAWIGQKLGIRDLTPEQISRLTFEQAVQGAVADITSGKAIRKAGENLENAEKNSIFAEQNNLNNDNRGKQYASNSVSRTFEEAKRELDTGTEIGRDKKTASREQQADRAAELLGNLERLAKVNGAWIETPEKIISFTPVSRGFENEVFESVDRNNVIKFNNLKLSEGNLDNFLDRIKAHNEFAPNTPYTILGIGKNSQGETTVILKQPHIKGKSAPIEKVMQFLKDNGFKPAKLSNGADGFRNDQYEISDLWKNDGSMMADNVLMDNEGNLYFIDADINRRINNGDYDLTSVADDINFQTEKPKAPNREDYTTVSEYLIALNGYNRQNRDANKARQARFNNAMLNGNYKAVQNFIEKNIDLKDKVKAVADFIKNTVSDTELNNSDWKYLLNRIQQARGSKTLESLLGEAYGRIIDSQIKQQLKNTETQLNIKMQEKAAGGNLKAKNTDNSTRLGLEELNRDRRLSSEEIEIRRKALEEELKEAEDNAGTVSEASLEAVNERFNGELQQFDNRTLKGDLHLGKPLGILQAAGINAKEITLSPIVLTAKLKQHGLTTKDLNGLSKAIQSPIMVYEWGTRAKSTIIVTELTTQDGRKITVAIKAERKGETLLVNDVASVHGKTAERFLSEMENAKEGGLKEALRYVEKEKALDWLGIAPPKGAAQAEGLNSIAKIIENFENPKIIEEDSHISGRKFAYADDIKARLDGLDMAEEYSEGIHGLQEKIKDTYEEMRNAFINNDMEFYSQLESSRNKDREELLTNTGKFNERLKDYIDSGKLKLKEWKAERKKIIENELHDGFIDLQNVKPVSTTEKEKKENKENRYFSITPKKLMKGLLHWGAEPIYSLEYMLRRIGGQKFIDGRGHLYNNIVPKWQAAEDTKQAGTKDINDRVKEKIKEIFGKDYDVTKAKDRSMKKMPDIKIEAKINGKPETIKLDAGKIMSIYAWNRQAEGAMKLRAMGIDHNKVNELAGLIDKRYIQFADWVTDELLPHTYEKYNRTHLKLFGTELPNIERYFPLVINPYSRQEKTDTSKSQDKNRPSVITGAIKTRTRNRYALDIDENFFDILNRHVNEMEDWNAYAALREDMNGLLSNTTFKNKLRALGDNFLDDFTKSVQTSLGQYHPNKNEKSEKIIQNLASNFAASKVSYNVWVAAKQILSSVLIMRYAAEPGFARYAVRNFTNIQGTIKWGLENLPSLERRWKSRNLGDENISRMGDNLNTKIVKLGMIPNAAMDLFASAAMARTVYDTSMEKYRSWGVKEDIAQREAKIEATVAFNTTQQSGESLYLSPLQVNKNWISKARTTFQNFNAGLQRITVASVKGLVKYYRTGKEQLIENEMRRLFSRFGLSGDRLRGIAEKEIKRQYYKNWGSILSVAAAIELYNMATYLWTDSDDKDNLLKETGLSALSTFTGGLSGMPILESTLRNVLTGNRWKESIASGIDPMLGDLEKFMNSPSEKNFIRTLITVTTSGLTGIDINRIAPIFEAAHIIADEGLASLDEVGVALLQLTGVPAGMIKDSKFTPRDDEMMITSKQGRDRGMIDNEIKETNKERVNRYMKRVTQIYNYLDTGVLGGYFSIQEKAKGITIPKMDRIIDTYSDYLFKRKEYKEDAEKIKKGLKEAAEAEREAMKTKIKIFDN